MSETVSNRKRRCSLFRHQDGSMRLQKEIQTYLHLLEENQEMKMQSPAALNVVLDNEDILMSVPDLENYVGVVTEFLNKHFVLRQEQEQINMKLDQLLQNII